MLCRVAGPILAMCAAVWLLGWAIILPVSIAAHLVSNPSPQRMTRITHIYREGIPHILYRGIYARLHWASYQS